METEPWNDPIVDIAVGGQQFKPDVAIDAAGNFVLRRSARLREVYEASFSSNYPAAAIDIDSKPYL